MKWTPDTGMRMHLASTALYRGFRFVAVIGALALSACINLDDTTRVARVSEVSGHNGTVTAGSNTGIPLVVKAFDQMGNSLEGTTVTWSIVSGGGSLSAETTETDAGGQAGVTYKPGSTPGNALVKASAGRLSVTFTVHVVAAASS